MSSFRRVALSLALVLPALSTVYAQSSSSASDSAAPAQSQAQQPVAGKTPSQLSVPARIKARREQRRAAAIRDVYTHLY